MKETLLKTETPEQLQAESGSRASTCSALSWTREKPTVEGAYFWRRARNCRDPWKWCLYYVCRVDTGEDMNIFEAGTEVNFPRGGQWAILAQNSKDVDASRPTNLNQQDND